MKMEKKTTVGISALASLDDLVFVNFDAGSENFVLVFRESVPVPGAEELGMSLLQEQNDVEDSKKDIATASHGNANKGDAHTKFAFLQALQFDVKDVEGLSVTKKLSPTGVSIPGEFRFYFASDTKRALYYADVTGMLL